MPPGAGPGDLEIAMVSHLDEIGGCLYGRRGDGAFGARHWGGPPDLFVGEDLQAMDWLCDSAERCVPAEAELCPEDPDRLVIRTADATPFRTVWTYRQKPVVSGDLISGKALDPRATVFAVAEAVNRLCDRRVGALFVLAEECAMDMARKAVTYLARHAPGLRLVVNADVPLMANLEGALLDMPAIRVFEGRNFIDPSVGIRASEDLASAGVIHALTSARSGSQTVLFSPLAPTISVALPGERIHTACATMSLTGIDRCVSLLRSLAARSLAER